LSEANTASDGALAGVRVIDLTINVLGPMATLMLGEMGADVIKIEAPGGDPTRALGARRNPGMAAHFVQFNRSKRSVELDLKSPAGKEAFLKLIDTADVFVHNMRAEAAVRLGIGPDDLRARNPKLICAYGTGYKADGPRWARPAFDDVIQGESGLAGLIGEANGEPRFVPYAMADKLCGVYLGAGILSALFHRERTGEGQVVHLPMFETMTSFNILDHMWQATFTRKPEDVGYPRMLTPHRRPYPTKDGHICLLAVTDAQWRRMFELMQRPDMAADDRFADMVGRAHHVDALCGEVAKEILKRTTAEWREALDAADIPNGPLNDLRDLIADPYLLEGGFFDRYDHPTDGPHMSVNFPLGFSATPTRMRRPPPLLGELNDEVLGELNADPAD